MSKSVFQRDRSNPHLTHEAHEIVGPPPPDACDDDTARRNADIIVRQLMEDASFVADVPEAHLPSYLGRTTRTVERPGRTPETERAAPTPARDMYDNALETTVEPSGGDPDKAVEETLRRILWENDEPVQETRSSGWGRILRPGTVLPVAFIAAAIAWPGLAIAALILMIWFALVLVWATSNEAVRGFLAHRWRGFATRHPAVAERLRQKADVIAMKLDLLLGILPESWAESLALPDFSPRDPGQNGGGARNGNAA